MRREFDKEAGRMVIVDAADLAPTAANVRLLLGRKWGAWGEFKRALVRAGIIGSVSDDCPPAWIAAYKRNAGR